MLDGVLARQHVRVESVGQIVEVTLGNIELKLDYESARRLGEWLQVCARESKRKAGDHSKQISVVGILSDGGEL